MEPIEKIKYKDYTIEIYPDLEPLNPREEYDHLGNMVCYHRRYDLGDHNPPEGVSDPTSLHKWLDKNDVIYLDIFMMDHSSITLSISKEAFQAMDPAGYDWGQVGVIYITAKDAKSYLGKRRLRMSDRVKILSALHKEVEEYSKYLNGEAYGYVVKDEEADAVESCWGFYDIDYCRDEAKEMVDFESSHTEFS